MKQKQTKLFLLFFIALMSITNSQGQKPGNVNSTVELWLKADAGVKTVTEKGKIYVDVWNDQSGKGRNFAGRNGRLGLDNNITEYRTSNDLMNFQPAIDFRTQSTGTVIGTCNKLLSDPLSIVEKGKTYYVCYVSRQTQAANKKNDPQVLFSFSTKTGLLELGISNLYDYGIENDLYFFRTGGKRIAGNRNDGLDYAKVEKLYAINAVWNPTKKGEKGYAYVNNEERKSFINPDDLNVPKGKAVIGSGGGGPGAVGEFMGDMQEIIVLSTTTGGFSDLDRQKINSYLSIKYGISMYNIFDYYDSDGNTVWDQSVNQRYNENVFGIGRDDKTGLNQKQSKNMEGSLTVYIGTLKTLNTDNTGTFSGDKQYLMLGESATSANTNESKIYKAQLSGLSSINVKMEQTSGSYNYILVSTSPSFPSGTSTKVYGITDEVQIDTNYKYIKFTTVISTAPPKSVVWTPETNTAGTDADKQDWNQEKNWTPAWVPDKNIDVYIPGNSTHYPQLSSTATCKDIYFVQGAELGRPDLLDYDNAYAHLNFDLKQSVQAKESNSNAINLVSDKDPNTSLRMKFSASTSTPLERERWYLFSAPLRNIVSGDFGLGATPQTFMRKFGPIVKDGKNYDVGNWTDNYTSYKEAITATEGFAFYMHGYNSSQPADYNIGTEEEGTLSSNEMTIFPMRRNPSFGLKHMNGIMEFPFYNNTDLLEFHRTQDYDPSSNISSFYYFQYNGSGYEIYNPQTPDKLTREANRGANRFIAESFSNGKWTFSKTLIHSTKSINKDEEILVGNPYMSSLDMVKFFNDNATAGIDNYFRIWDGTGFVDYSVSNGTVTSSNPNSGSNPGYISPWQSFILKKNVAGNVDIKFNVEKISTTRPANTKSNLRNAGQETEENLIRIKSENDNYASHLVVAYRENADNSFREREVVKKLFSPFGEVPEIYTLAGEIPTSINFICGGKDLTVPVGIKTEQLGTIKFTFTGMNRYQQSKKITFTDVLTNTEIDLTGKDSYTYSFENQMNGIQNDRFFLRFYGSPTALNTPEIAGDIQAYNDGSGISVRTLSSDKIRQVIIYDIGGRKIYENNTLSTNHLSIGKRFEALYLIVKVVTDNQTKNIKIINK